MADEKNNANKNNLPKKIGDNSDTTKNKNPKNLEQASQQVEDKVIGKITKSSLGGQVPIPGGNLILKSASDENIGKMMRRIHDETVGGDQNNNDDAKNSNGDFGRNRNIKIPKEGQGQPPPISKQIKLPQKNDPTTMGGPSKGAPKGGVGPSGTDEKGGIKNLFNKNPGAKKNNQSDSDGGGITSPEGVLMLFVALFFDIIGIVLNICFDLNAISDAFAIVIIGIWFLSRTGDIKSSFSKGKGGEQNMELEDMIGKVLKKFGITYLIKIIPFVGSFLSLWTYRVWKELGGIGGALKSNNEESEEDSNIVEKENKNQNTQSSKNENAKTAA